MKDLFRLVLLVGMFAFVIGCGGAPVEEAPTDPAPEEIESNEDMGALPSE